MNSLKQTAAGLMMTVTAITPISDAFASSKICLRKPGHHLSMKKPVQIERRPVMDQAAPTLADLVSEAKASAAGGLVVDQQNGIFHNNSTQLALTSKEQTFFERNGRTDGVQTRQKVEVYNDQAPTGVLQVGGIISAGLNAAGNAANGYFVGKGLQGIGNGIAAQAPDISTTRINEKATNGGTIGNGGTTIGGNSGNAFSKNSGNTVSSGGSVGGKNNTTTGDYGNAQSANGKGAGFNTGTNGVTNTGGKTTANNDQSTNKDANLSNNVTQGAGSTNAEGGSTATGGVSSTQSCYNADNGSGNSGYANPNQDSTVPGSIYSGGTRGNAVKCKGPTL